MSHKILYLTPSATLLGARRSLLFLLERLDRNKFTPVVVCSKEGDLTEELKKREIQTEILRFHGWRKLRNIKYIPSTIISLSKLVKKEKIALIHCNEFWLNPYGIIAAKIARIPCITHMRTSLSANKVRNYLLSYADRLIAVSGETKRLIRMFPEIFKKTDVVYNGVDIEQFNPDIKCDSVKKEFNIAPDEIIIGTIGQLYPDKGQKTFIEAADIILKKYPKTKFLVVGEAKKEKYKTELLALVNKLGIEDKVVFTGKRDDIPQVLATFDIFALPTLNEGFARVIIEAMACGKPVIATNVGGNAEAIIEETTGFIILKNSADVLAQKIIELIENKDKRIEMGRRGRERVVNNFSVEQYVENIEKIYNEVLRN